MSLLVVCENFKMHCLVGYSLHTLHRDNFVNDLSTPAKPFYGHYTSLDLNPLIFCVHLGIHQMSPLRRYELRWVFSACADVVIVCILRWRVNLLLWMKIRCTESREDASVQWHCPHLRQCMFTLEVTDRLLMAVFLVEVFMTVCSVCLTVFKYMYMQICCNTHIPLHVPCVSKSDILSIFPVGIILLHFALGIAMQNV